MERLLSWLAAAVLRYPGRLVGIWLALTVASTMGAVRLPAVLHAGPGTVPESPSQRVEQLLRHDFHFTNAFPLVIVAEGYRPVRRWREQMPLLATYLKNRH